MKKSFTNTENLQVNGQELGGVALLVHDADGLARPGLREPRSGALPCEALVGAEVAAARGSTRGALGAALAAAGRDDEQQTGGDCRRELSGGPFEG